MSEPTPPAATPPAATPPAAIPPAATPPAATPPAPTGIEIPQEFADKPWAQDLKGKTIKEVFSKLAAAEALVGRKGLILPSEQASPDEWQKVLSEALRPKDKSQYTFSAIPELKDEKPNEAAQAILRDIFHEANLHPLQALKVQQGIDRAGVKAAQERKAQIDKMDAEFEALTATVFGENKDAVLGNVKQYLVDILPPALKERTANLPADALAVIAATVDVFTKKYVHESGLNHLTGGASGAASSGNSMESLRAQRLAIMSNPAYRDQLSADHQRLVAQVEAINDKMRKLSA